jgi:gliding motility-associated-like protein
VSTIPSPIVDLGNDTSLCQGESLTLDATISNATYLWQDNSNAASLMVSNQGTYWVSVTVNGCSSMDTIMVLSIPYPTPSLGNDTTLCQGAVLLLDASTAGASYSWQDQSTNPTFHVTQQGTYWVVVAYGNCSGSDTIIVDIAPPPVFDLGTDTSLCSGDTLMLDATTPGATYLWQDNTQGPTFEIHQEGVYWVNVTLNGCTVADTISIDYLSTPVARLGNDTTICEGSRLVLEISSPDVQCLWMNELSGPIYVIHQEGSYWVEVSNSCGLDADTLNVGTTICDCPVYIADAFTPNNDFVNDEFSPKTNCEYILYSFVIFDRWGEKIFETDQSSIAWDGTYHGKVVPAGIYVYHLTYRFEMAPELVRCGTITVIR